MSEALKSTGVLYAAGKTAVITGAARGIGFACAQKLGANGARVVLIDVGDLTHALSSLAEQGIQAIGCQVDISHRAQLKAAIVNLNLERVDFLVCAAGVLGDIVELEKLDEAELERVLGINLKGTIWTLQAALPLMKEGGGSVVMIGSVAADLGGQISGAPYTTSKGGVHSLVKWSSKQLAKDGIRVNAVSPGTIETEMTRGKPYRTDACPLNRFGTVEEVADAVSFLLSPAASFTTGAILNVNGGLYMG